MSDDLVQVRFGSNLGGLLSGLSEASAAVGRTAASMTSQLRTIGITATQTGRDVESSTRAASTGIASMVGPLVAFYGAWKAINLSREFVSVGVAANAMVEQARLGIGGLIAAQTTVRDATGSVVTGAKAMDVAIGLAADQVQALRIAGIQTAATTEQLITGYQAALGAGLAAGLTLDQIREVTVRIVQAAGAMGIPMHQIRTEVGQILTGTIDQNALVGRNLGLTNALVENWKRQGTLASELLKRTAAFEEAGKRTASSWSGVTSSLQEATQVIAGAVTKPLFDAMESGLNRALSGVFDITSGTISTRLAGLVSGFQGLFSSIGSGASAVIGGAVSILQDLSAWLERNRERFGALVSAIGSGASAAASAIGNLVGVFLRLLDAAIEPLTVVLNALAVVLDSVVGQVAIFARILIGPLVSAGTAATGIILRLADGLRLQLALGAMEGVTGIRALGGAVVGMVGPVGLAVAGALALGFGLERLATSARRAADEKLRLAENTASEVADFGALISEARRLKTAIDDQNTSDERRKALQAQLATLLERIALISPEIASDLQKATSANRDLNKVLDEQIEKRERLLNAEIAETKLALANAEQALAKARRVNEVLEDQAAAQSGEEAGLGGAMLATTLQIKDQAAAVESLTKALDALLQAKQSLAPSGEASGSSTPAPNLGGDSKDASNKLVEQWRESLEDIKASQESTWSWSTEREREFWASKLALTKAGTDAYRVVRRTVNQLDQQLAKEAHEATLATARAELDAAEQSGADRIAIARRIVAEEERVHGAGSPQAIAAARAAAAEERKVGEESIALRLRQIQGQIDAEDDLSERRVELARRAEEIIIGFYGAESEEAQRAANRRAEIERRLQTAIADDARRSIEAKTTARLDDLDEAEKHIRDLREMGLISAAQERADLLALENAKFEIRVAALREILALGNIEEAERRELLRRLEQLERDHYARVGEIENEATKDVSTKVDGFLQPLMSTWEAGLAKMLQGQLSFSQAVQGIWGSLRQAVAQVIAKMLIDYLAMLAKKLLMTVAMKIKELLVHQATAKASTAASVAQATTEVGAKGASAAAGAASSAASIPGIGWIIAIPAALAVLGAVLAMKSNIGSAAGGWDIGNFAPVAQLHANEMVLPAHLADRVRNMTEPDQGDGGAVGSIAVTIQALDGASVERVLRDNDREFGRVIERLVRQRKVAL